MALMEYAKTIHEQNIVRTVKITSLGFYGVMSPYPTDIIVVVAQ